MKNEILGFFCNMMETIKNLKQKCLFIVFMRKLFEKLILMYLLTILLNKCNNIDIQIRGNRVSFKFVNS